MIDKAWGMWCICDTSYNVIVDEDDIIKEHGGEYYDTTWLVNDAVKLYVKEPKKSKYGWTIYLKNDDKTIREICIHMNVSPSGTSNVKEYLEKLTRIVKLQSKIAARILNRDEGEEDWQVLGHDMASLLAKSSWSEKEIRAMCKEERLSAREIWSGKIVRE